MTTHAWHVIFDPRTADDEADRIAKAISAFDVTVDFESCPSHHCIAVRGLEAEQAAASLASDIDDPEEAIISVTCSDCGTDARLPRHTCGTEDTTMTTRPTARQRALLVASLRRLGERIVLGAPASAWIESARIGTWPDSRREATAALRECRAVEAR